MPGAQQRRRIADPTEQLAPRHAALLTIVISAHGKFWVARLDRRMDHVAANDCVGSGFADLHREMIDGMPRRRDQFDDIGQLVVAGHHLLTSCCDDWQHRVDDPRLFARIVALLLGPERQFPIGKYILRLRECRHPLPILQPRVPADVIDMHMGAHDIVDVVHSDVDRSETAFVMI
jgi:hypothetical protein